VNVSFSFFGFGIETAFPSTFTTILSSPSLPIAGRIRATMRTWLVFVVAIISIYFVC
jgi:hypothetical protein